MCATRRQFLSDLARAGFGLTSLAMAIAACSRSALPEGLVEVHWDLDTCIRCNMVISDRRFAAQVHGGPKGQTWKCDDIGCAVFWLQAQPWGREATTKIWVADAAGGDRAEWLDARQAYYARGKASPMGYNFAAGRAALPGSLDFESMRQHVLAKGR